MSSTYLSPSLNFYKQARSNNNCSVLADLSSVGVWEVGTSFPLLSTLLPGWLLQYTLHASVCFAGCKHSNPSVLPAGKWRSQTEILMNTGTHLEKKKLLLKNNETYSAAFTVVIAGNIQLLLLLLEQLANVHWYDASVSVNHTCQEPPPQI